VIDRGLTDEWPQKVAAAAQRFQQGDLIRKPLIGYAASLTHPIWQLSRLEAEVDQESESAFLVLDEDDLPPYGVILSQTCDVTEDRPEPVQPWIDVSPVYEYELQEDSTPPEYLYVLETMRAEKNHTWVVDLRLVVSIEKGLLVGREPIDPFAGSEGARIEFGVALGQRYARAALSEGVHVFIDETLQQHKPRKTGKRVAKRVYALLLDITEGGRLDPKVVRLHVVCQETERITQEEAEEWFRGWWDEAHLIAMKRDVNLLIPTFHDSASMDVKLYARLVAIRCPL
jgi:hypothetical protein